MRRGLVKGTGLLALLAVLAACGGDDGGTEAAATTAAPPASSTTPATTTAAAGEVDLTRLPVGDELVQTDGPEAGTLYLCPTFPTDGGGASVQGPWFNGDGTYDLTAKAFVQGEVTWDDAAFSVDVEGDTRVLAGNDLPVDHTTGEFPIAADDPARQYDQNPNGIVANDYEIDLAADPQAAAQPSCVGGEVGFLLSGVVLNSPVDAEGRDAVAWESQDHCEGHPNPSGYHYHSVSPCVPDEGTGHSDLLGYALDGYGIYGHRGEGGEVLTDDDLDECHGHTHEIEWDGQLVERYHYHATWEFPYVVGCFHGTSAAQGPVLPHGDVVAGPAGPALPPAGGAPAP